HIECRFADVDANAITFDQGYFSLLLAHTVTFLKMNKVGWSTRLDFPGMGHYAKNRYFDPSLSSESLAIALL
ncbi:MAG: hypothetical protein ACI9LO_002695, partial [Planctomycetota bacterium]